MQQELKQLDVAALGRRLRVVREDRRMTREELAEAVDKSTTFIAGIEYGNKCPSVRSLFLFSQALGVTADYLLCGGAAPGDEEAEAVGICEEIVQILSRCDIMQLESFRDISLIYADAVRSTTPR